VLGQGCELGCLGLRLELAAGRVQEVFTLVPLSRRTLNTATVAIVNPIVNSKQAPRIRVVHVLDSLGPGGLERGVINLIRNASENFEHSIVCLSRSGSMAAELPEGTLVLELGKPAGNSARFIWRLARTLKELRPNITHTRNWGGLDAVLAARLARIWGVVHGEHGWGVDDPQGQNRKRLLVRRFLSRWVREFTCVSKQMEQWLKSEVRVRKPVTQIYNGVFVADRLSAEEGSKLRDRLGLARRTFVAGIVARLDPIKDHETLFRAFRVVRKKASDVRLVVIGDGPERQRLMGLAEEGTLFLRHRPDATTLLRALDVFVLPSINEGISNTILEAMAAGLPVIASNAGGNPELVVHGETGFLFQVGDAEGLASNLLRYREQAALRRQHGDAGRQRAERKFTIRRMVERYEEVYRRVGLGPGKEQDDETAGSVDTADDTARAPG